MNPNHQQPPPSDWKCIGRAHKAPHLFINMKRSSIIKSCILDVILHNDIHPSFHLGLQRAYGFDPALTKKFGQLIMQRYTLEMALAIQGSHKGHTINQIFEEKYGMFGPIFMIDREEDAIFSHPLPDFGPNHPKRVHTSVERVLPYWSEQDDMRTNAQLVHKGLYVAPQTTQWESA